MKKNKKISADPYSSIRRSVPPPNRIHRDRTKYERSPKHKIREGEEDMNDITWQQEILDKMDEGILETDDLTEEQIHWICHDVLPSIRKYGFYATSKLELYKKLVSELELEEKLKLIEVEKEEAK